MVLPAPPSGSRHVNRSDTPARMEQNRNRMRYTIQAT
jgi:hypothetical protein